ncbi:MAG: fused MFS/spermidine synthase [Solirubrobacterales bacterium]|nr:fused MFS/spermidine synthase [Solirubrobacterales bacterium]
MDATKGLTVTRPLTDRYLYLLVFATGALTMGTEIAGARLLAPYFGDSTIVWANTIAVVLVALSTGYWLGGRLADRHPDLGYLCRVVLAGAALIALVPFLARPFLGASVEAFDRVSIGGFAGSLIGVLVLLAVPVMVMGTVSPWAVRIGMDRVESSGQVAGRLYAISTAGSLVGTMVSALVTIPLLGTQRTFLLFALVVALVAVAGAGWRWMAVPASVAVLAVLPVGTIKAAGPGRVLYETETPHQYARVVETADGERRLELNEGQAIHSIYRPGSYLVGGYWDESLVLPFTTLKRPPARVAILGNAGGTIARSFGHFFPRSRVDGVEIDAKLTELGRRYFDLGNPRMRVFDEDARPWLRRSEPGYDVIIVDTYRQPYIPFYMATREFFDLVRDRLSPDGVVLINVGHPEGSNALERTLTRTMSTALPAVKRDPVTSTNTMLIGGRTTISPARLARSASGLPAGLRPVARAAAARLEPGFRGGSIWTDDRAPVEWMVDLSLLEYAGG